jgi:hypothetical protein
MLFITCFVVQGYYGRRLRWDYALLRNVGTYLPNYMTSHTTRQSALLFSVCFYIFQVAVPGVSWKLQSARLEVSSLSSMHVLGSDLRNFDLKKIGNLIRPPEYLDTSTSIDGDTK